MILAKAAVLMVGLQAARADAIPPALSDVVGDDAIAALLVAGPPESASDPAQGQNTVAIAGFLADQAVRLGVLSQVDDCTRMWLDSFAGIADAFHYPHAIVLFDVSVAARRDGGHQLAGLDLALVLRTRGQNDPIESRIRHLLATYTNSTETTITKSSANGNAAHALVDMRLPPWARITWGPIGENYVLAIGRTAYKRMARQLAQTNSMPGKYRGTGASTAAQDRWLAGALWSADGRDASAVLLSRFDLLLDTVDAALARKIRRVLSELELGDIQRGLWAFGRNERAVTLKSVLRRGGRDVVTTVAAREIDGLPMESVIPKQAGGYAILDSNPLTAFRAIREGYLASRSPRAQERIRSFWGGLETSSGVSVDRDVCTRLTGPIVIHNYPRHALNLPLAWTILVPIAGDAAALRTSIDRFLKAGADLIEPGGLFQLHHDDGVWYIQYGVKGPGVMITDRWMILSFSPHAVRENAKWLSRPTPTADPDQSTSSTKASTRP